MAASKTARFRAITEDEILALIPNLPYRSSCHLNWIGVEVHRYLSPPGIRKEHSFKQLAIFLPQVEKPYNGELWIGGSHMRASIGSHSVSIVPAGVQCSNRRDALGEATAIFIDPASTLDMARLEIGTAKPEVRLQYGIEDPVIRSIGQSLDNEIAAAHPSPRIYAESLASALTAHIFAKYAVHPPREFGTSPSLNEMQLRRSIEFINDNLDQDITLSQIAAVANMSKYHFAKSFRQLSGIAPHQYLIRRRIERARTLLSASKLPIEEIANRVGYSDKCHFAAQFLRIVGTSPSGYRRKV